MLSSNKRQSALRHGHPARRVIRGPPRIARPHPGHGSRRSTPGCAWSCPGRARSSCSSNPSHPLREPLVLDRAQLGPKLGIDAAPHTTDAPGCDENFQHLADVRPSTRRSPEKAYILAYDVPPRHCQTQGARGALRIAGGQSQPATVELSSRTSLAGLFTSSWLDEQEALARRGRGLIGPTFRSAILPSLKRAGPGQTASRLAAGVVFDHFGWTIRLTTLLDMRCGVQDELTICTSRPKPRRRCEAPAYRTRKASALDRPTDPRWRPPTHDTCPMTVRVLTRARRPSSVGAPVLNFSFLRFASMRA